ncbi:VOC family protein [Spirosoma foliorum]|uniref:VOC family protein n=1 Tax=Spirosoma foliorum TaxID=2710596 RepID=A0A7G5H2Y2_9BACT|nr:VOC family protein [Spirosoma foliorum]QMW05474.1 VOC family protein [Spirosoma foliorum]
MADTTFLGLRTVIYAAPNLSETKEWYTKAFGVEPYFDQPFYVGFNIGGFELGLDPNAQIVEGSTLTYWGVSDIGVSVQNLVSLGATLHSDIQDVGEGIKVSAVRDPFGNVIGVIENPHFSNY